MDSVLLGRRILVVEDEIVITWLLEDILTALGCTIISTAARVKQALSMIETDGPFDAVVLDINLNGEKSYPVADALFARGIPFVFSTGYNKDSLPKAYQDFQMVQKPYRQAEMAAALIAILTPVKPEHLDHSSADLNV